MRGWVLGSEPVVCGATSSETLLPDVVVLVPAVLPVATSYGWLLQHTVSLEGERTAGGEAYERVVGYGQLMSGSQHGLFGCVGVLETSTQKLFLRRPHRCPRDSISSSDIHRNRAFQNTHKCSRE